MTFNEFKVLAKGMKAVYTAATFLPDEDSIKIWYRLLQDIPYEVANIAIQRHMMTNKFPPTVADLREQVAQMMDGDLTADWAAGWAQVTRAIGAYGMWNPDAAIENMDAITRECVKRLGWKELCMSENPTADRANFRMIYEQVQRKKVEAAALPAGLKKDMLQLGEKMKLIGGQDETI